MDTSLEEFDPEEFIPNLTLKTRLEQAIRVMKELINQGREHLFNIEIFARKTDDGIVGCIAGHCGLDPWFQEQGLVTDVEKGRISVSIHAFFGTDQPFYKSFYPQGEKITVTHAIAALQAEINLLS